jgi:hypothetical protein
MIHSQGPSKIFAALFGNPSGTADAPADRIAFVSLLAANILPILLALVFGWNVGDVVTFYWLENIIIGFWVIPRLLTANRRISLDPNEINQHLASLTHPSEPQVIAPRQYDNLSEGAVDSGQQYNERKPGSEFEKYFIVPFFCFHYFFFCFVHGVFVRIFASGAVTGNASVPLPFDTPEGGSWPGPLAFVQFFYLLLSNSLGGLSTGGLLAVTGLMISHGVSYFRNYIGHGEYKRTYAIVEMFRPYPRIVVLHIGIVIGGIATLLLGSPLLLVVILMIGKTALDAKLHLSSHTTLTTNHLSHRRVEPGGNARD